MSEISRQDSAFTEQQLTHISEDSRDGILRHDSGADSATGGFAERLTFAITRTVEINVTSKTASNTSPAMSTGRSRRPPED